MKLLAGKYKKGRIINHNQGLSPNFGFLFWLIEHFIIKNVIGPKQTKTRYKGTNHESSWHSFQRIEGNVEEDLRN